MNEALVRDLIDQALARKITFTAILAALAKEGVESYHVDFLRDEVRYYTRQGDSLVTKAPLVHGPVALAFSVEQLESINKRVQAGEASFADFVKEGAAAGCACYIVYLNGKKVRYFGRDGGEHVQIFPGSR